MSSRRRDSKATGHRRRRKAKPATSSRTRRLADNGKPTASPKVSQQFWHGKDVGKVASEIGSQILNQHLDVDLNGDLSGSSVGSSIGNSIGDVSANELAVVTATVRSLGAPPLAGREIIAEHYFDAAYQRAAAMAQALLTQAAEHTAK